MAGAFDKFRQFGRNYKLLIFIIALSVLVGVGFWYHKTALNNMDFQAYEPAVYPANTHIVSRKLLIWSGEINHPELLLTLSKADVDTSEEKAANTKLAIPCAMNQICETLTTPRQ